MIFDSSHYVPVLKIKRGEKNALQALSVGVQSRMTPLLEVIERTSDKAPTVPGHLDTAFKNLGPAVAAFPRYFLDCREIEPDGAGAATDVFARAAALGTPFTPVTGISREADLDAALGHRVHGVAIRLTRAEFEASLIPTALPAFLGAHGLDPAEVDLLLDLGAVEDMVADGIMALASAFLADVPDHNRWRTLTVSGCAFPASVGSIGRNSHAFVERAEWQAWRDGLHATRTSILRLPTFSDCAIQHPAGVERFDPRTMQVSASIRYTLAESWLLIKGESTRRTPPGQQFPQLATQLAYGHLSAHFAGSNHCAGCRGMQDAADGAPRLGSLEAWRRLGTIHHLTRAVEELAGLTWP